MNNQKETLQKIRNLNLWKQRNEKRERVATVHVEVMCLLYLNYKDKDCTRVHMNHLRIRSGV